MIFLSNNYQPFTSIGQQANNSVNNVVNNNPQAPVPEKPKLYIPPQYEDKLRKPKKKLNKETLQPAIDFVKRGSKALLKKVVPGAIIMTIAFGVNNNIRSSQTHHQADSTRPTTSSKIYDAGYQHAVDSIKIADYEKQIKALEERVASDSIKILELTSKARKVIK